MGRIRVLDDGLINRIAAGEVVERPASVLKELVENSLDAGATSLEVELRGGGRTSIRVRDDGRGMDRDDALLALERHATSKLREARDLDAIATLGFRGEALASIAAVSRFTLETAPGDGEGTRVRVRGGRILDVATVGLPRGTTVEVAGLFFNTPARRKFLRAENTEYGHCLRWLTRYALAHPERRFRLRHGERVALDLPPAPDYARRVGQVAGSTAMEALLPVEGREGDVRVHGFAGRPVATSTRTEGQHLFVNGRAVTDRVLAHAIREAYANTIVPGRHPTAYLYVDLPPGDVDVNVHPRKTEVRFREAARVHDLVRDAVAASLSSVKAVPRLGDLRPAALPESPVPPKTPTLHEAPPPYAAPPAPPPPRPAAPAVPAPAAERPAKQTAEIFERPRSPRALAQYRDSYLIAADDDGLVLVDQHAAHERVLFEKLLAQARTDRVPTQDLIFPVPVELSAAELAEAEGDLDAFRRLGFRLEPFGNDTIRLDGIPAVAGEIPPDALFRELLGAASRATSAAADVERIRCRMVTTASCKAAIKVNHALTHQGQQALLDDLFASDNPTTCPHGRPIVFRLSREEIERAFRRR